MNDPAADRSARIEWTAILALTALAALLRLAGFGRLGLDHFDEGIYASVGMWSLAPGGLAELDPGVIPYAPPGYPVLVGLAYWLAGPTDRVAIVVSILAGIAAVPVTAWLARRTFGAGAGVAAAAFAGVSMPHIVFSRMALTDATFVLAWLVAMAIGARFLERPGPWRAVALGLAVGLAQLVKYNGWLVGAIVAATAALGPLVSADQRRREPLLRAFGWGGLAAVVAALVYAPWFHFVERYGGYSGLLAHQRGYLDGPSAWPANWLLQLRQLAAFSPSSFVAILGPILAIVGVVAIVAMKKRPLRGPLLAMVGPAVLSLTLYGPSTTWWIGLGLVGFLIRDPSPAVRLIAVWWAALTVLTPLYHPYARLWLPLEACGWMLGGCVIAAAFRWAESGQWPPPWWQLAGIVTVLLASWIAPRHVSPSAMPLPGAIAEPRDSLRAATSRIVAKIPTDVRAVRMLGRPAMIFYAAPILGGRGIAGGRLADSQALLEPHDGAWAIVDAVQLRQEGVSLDRLLGRWEIAAQEPTTLSNATLLDVDPAAAVGDLSARSEPLYLLRPR